MKVLINKFIILFFLILWGCDFTPRIHKTILEAQDLLLAQKYDLAISKYESVLKTSSNEVIRTKILFQLSEIYLLHFGNNKKALSLLHSILDDTKDVDALIKAEEKMGDIYFSFTHEYKKSASCYQRLIRFLPKLPDQNFYLYRYARSELGIGNYLKAIKIFNKLLKDKKYAMDSQFFIGKCYFFNKNWVKAVETLSKYVANEKPEKLIEAQFIIANSYEGIGNLKKAYDTYYSLLAYYPNPEVIRNKLNSIYQRQISSKR